MISRVTNLDRFLAYFRLRVEEEKESSFFRELPPEEKMIRTSFYVLGLTYLSGVAHKVGFNAMEPKESLRLIIFLFIINDLYEIIKESN